MGRSQAYTPAQRRHAVGVALVLGDDVAASKLNIPRRTVSYWRSQPEYQTLAPEAQAWLGRMMWEGVAVGVKAVVEGLMDPTSQLRDRAVAVGILSDKALLLSGMATNRTETTTTAADVLTHEQYIEVRDAVQEEIEIRAGGPVAPGEIEELRRWLAEQEVADGTG